MKKTTQQKYMNAQNSWIAADGTLSFFHHLSCQVKHIPLKRIFDIVFSLFVLLLCLPLLLFIAMAIRFSSSGKIVYSQERIGRGGTPFRCYKFRTMYPDADQLLQQILKKDEEKRKEWEQNHKLKNDPRITPIGAFLRRTSLDELPQFWNVLKGDLSVVGPRPVVSEEIIKHYKSKAYKILSIRPGITGMWQISGRSNTTYQQRIALDEYYVDRRTFMLDMKIVALTIPSMITKKGAY